MQSTRKPGRPPLRADEKLSVPICVMVTPRQFDRLDARAKQQRVSIPEYLRRVGDSKYSK